MSGTSNIEHSTPNAEGAATRSLSTRPALERIREIVVTLSKGEPCNARTLAEKHQVSTKTIHRDFDFLRHLGHELTYHRSSWSYRYVVPAAVDVILPTAAKVFTPEVVALLAAVDAALKDTRFWWEWEDALKAAREKFPESRFQPTKTT